MYTTLSIVSLVLLALVMIGFFLLKRSRKPPFFILPILIMVGIGLQYLGMRYEGTESIRIQVIQSVFNGVKMIGADFRHEPVSALINDNVFYFISLFLIHISVLFYTVYYVIAFVSLKTTNWFRIQWSRLFVHYVISGDEVYVKAFIRSIRQKTRITLLFELEKHTNEEAIYDTYSNLNQRVKVAFMFKPILEKTYLNFLVPRCGKTLYIVSLFKDDERNKDIIHAVSKLLVKRTFPNVCFHSFYQHSDSMDDLTCFKNLRSKSTFFNIHDLCVKKFVQDYPFTRIISSFIDVEHAKVRKHDYHYHLIGFGEFSQKLLKHVLMMNQFNQLVNYHVYTQERDMRYETFVRPLRIFYRSKCCADHLGNIADYYTDAYYETPNNIGNVSFTEIDVSSLSFNKIIKTKVTESDDVNIFIIALGDNTLNMHTARTLRKYLVDENLEINTSVFVKLSDAKHYEEISSSLLPIVPFGHLSSIITHENIIDMRMDRLARAAHDYYNRRAKRKLTWEQLEVESQNSNRMAAMHIRTKLNLIGLDLVEGKVDSSTKALFYEHYDPYHFVEKKNEYNDVSTFYGEHDSTPRYQIAVCEHLRWNVYHFLLGYVPMKKSVFLENLKNPNKEKKSSDMDIDKHRHVCLTSVKGLFDISHTMVEQGYPLEESDYFKYDFTLFDDLPDILLNDEDLNLTIIRI